MSNRRDEDFDSIYASIEDDDMEEMYVDVLSSTPPNEEVYDGPWPSPYVAPRPPSPPGRKLPPLPVKPTAGAASKPPWPRKAPHPPPNQPSVKIQKKSGSSELNRDIPQPLPRVGTVKKKELASKPAVKSRAPAQYQQQGTGASKTGYSPPPPVIAANSGDERQGYSAGYQRYPQEVAATTAAAAPKTRYQDSGFGTGKFAGREPPGPASTGYKLPYNQPPPPSHPPPPLLGGTNGQGFNGQILNTPDESEYESLRPARQRILRGFGQQSRRSRRYSDDRIPLQDLAGDHDNSNISDGGYQTQREKKGGESVQNNSKIVCILLTIIVIALLISLMSLVMSLYTLTRFELSQRVNNTASECDIKVTNCSTDLSDVDCQTFVDQVCIQ